MKPANAHLQLNKAHFPVTVLGPGQRIGLWLQGCSIGCKGCVSVDTWERDPQRTVAISSLLTWCKQVAGSGLDGVTISGGEPFDQPEGLRHLLQALRLWRSQARLDFDILCYSGYPLKTLQQRHARLLALLDALIPEPFIDSQSGVLWRGSSNQPLVPLSPLGQQRYAAFVCAPLQEEDKRMQVAVEGGRVWMIGIPARGDMTRIEALCRSRGLTLEQVSWRR
ncbi:MAG: 4Fe-4S cluster-binding domain-containing protein [Rhodoferax sp.]|nr:4Fe-4S cluster-binding domain-containing protein [Rhodoferax sp.]